MSKLLFVQPSLYNKILQNKNKKTIITHSRKTSLLPYNIDNVFSVHTGKTFLYLKISEDIVGHKIGEFAQTRKRYLFKKGKQKQKQK